MRTLLFFLMIIDDSLTTHDLQHTTVDSVVTDSGHVINFNLFPVYD